MQVKIGDIVHGKISGIQQYGIFVRLDSQIEGLIHISEIHGGYVKDIGREYQVGETIKVAPHPQYAPPGGRTEPPFHRG